MFAGSEFFYSHFSAVSFLQSRIGYSSVDIKTTIAWLVTPISTLRICEDRVNSQMLYCNTSMKDELTPNRRHESRIDRPFHPCSGLS